MKYHFVYALSFLLTGLVSTWFFLAFHWSYDSFELSGIFSGCLFIACLSIILAMIVKRLKFKQIIKLSASLFLTYLVLYFLTTQFYIIIELFGMLASGFGALSVFYFVDTCVIPINYSVRNSFLFGAAAFMLTMLLKSVEIPDLLIGDIYNDRLKTNYALLILFWQTIIGYLVMQKVLYSINEGRSARTIASH